MQAKFSFPAAIIIVVLCLSGCSGKGADNDFEAATSYGPQEKSLFAPIINAYAELERSGFAVFDRDLIGHSFVAELNYYVSRHIPGITPGWWHMPRFLYAFYDINGDGTPELFIGADAGIAGVYALQNGVPVSVVQVDQHVNIWLSTDIYGRYVIGEAWSRMNQSEYVFSALGKSANLITLTKVFTTYRYDGSAELHTESTNGETVNITTEEFDKLLINYGASRRVNLDWKPILDYPSKNIIEQIKS